jgi:hypothetical protein
MSCNVWLGVDRGHPGGFVIAMQRQRWLNLLTVRS